MLLMLTGLFACKEKKLSNYSYTADSMIMVKTTACFGTCPMFTFSIDGMGNATYMGKKFTKKEGAHQKQFNAQETNAIFKAFENADYFNFEDKYTADVTDLQTTYLTFKHRGQEKKITLYYEIPAELKELSMMAKKYAETEAWTKTKDN